MQRRTNPHPKRVRILTQLLKGKEYELLDIAIHSETLEEMVVYRALYGEQKLWVRPADMWEEEVEVDGKKIKRFAFVKKGM